MNGLAPMRKNIAVSIKKLGGSKLEDGLYVIEDGFFKSVILIQLQFRWFSALHLPELQEMEHRLFLLIQSDEINLRELFYPIHSIHRLNCIFWNHRVPISIENLEKYEKEWENERISMTNKWGNMGKGNLEALMPR